MAIPVEGKTRWGRWLLAILFALFVIVYVAAWFIMKPMIESFADDWVEQQRAMGATVEYSERRVEGFPLNFELVFDDPVYGAPGGAVLLDGEQVRLESRTWDFVTMLTMNRARLSAYLPGETLVKDNRNMTVKLDLDKASRLYAAWNKDGLEAASLKLNDFAAVSETEEIATEAFELAVKPSNSLVGTFDLNLSWDSIKVPDEFVSEARRSLDGAPASISSIANGILEGLERGDAADIPMPNALALEPRLMLFGMPLN